MIIILEGPDASGKSTLAKQLSKQTGMEIIHNSAPKTDEDRDNMFYMYAKLISLKNNVILDRSWYSEMVYGAIMRKKSCIDVDEMLHLESIIANNSGGMILHCTNKADVLWDRAQSRGEDYVKEKSVLTEIKHGFEHVMHNMKHEIPVVRYETPKNL